MIGSVTVSLYFDWSSISNCSLIGLLQMWVWLEDLQGELQEEVRSESVEVLEELISRCDQQQNSCEQAATTLNQQGEDLLQQLR